MKIWIVAAVAALEATVLAASASAAPNTSSQTCAALKADVTRNGVIVRRYRQRDTRFVRQQSLCPYSAVLNWAIVPARDTRRCFLKRCQEKVFRSRGR